MANGGGSSLSDPIAKEGGSYSRGGSTIRSAAGTDTLETFDQSKSIEDAMTAIANATGGGGEGFNPKLKQRIEDARTPAQKARLESKLERREMRQGERAENVQERKNKRKTGLEERQAERGFTYDDPSAAPEGTTTGTEGGHEYSYAPKKELTNITEDSADQGFKSAAESNWMKSMSAIAKNMPAAGGSGSFLPK